MALTSTSTIRVNWDRKPAWADLLPTLGLVGWWRLNDPTGTQAIDRAGGNHGTYVGSPTLAQATLIPEDADEDYSVLLNGSSQYVTIPDANSLDLGDVFTIGGVAQRRVAGAKHYILHKGANSAGVYVSAADALTVEKVGTGDMVAASTTVTTGAFFWCLTKNGSALHLYQAKAGVAGSIDVTGSVTSRTMASTAAAMEIGRSSVPGSYFDGTMDEVFVGGVVLTPSQVSQLAAAFLQGELNGPIDTLGSRVTGWSSTSGRNASLGPDRIGQLTLTCRNGEPNGERHFFTPERNLVPNASFGSGLHDLSTTLAPLSAGATLAWVADAPTGAGSYSAKITTTGADQGGGSPLEGFFPAGQPVTFAISALASSGTPTLQLWLGSSGTPADSQTANRVLSTSWQDLASITFTPAADCSDLAWLARDHAGASITFSVNKVGVNRGSTANTWVNGPTWPMLQPGALVHAAEAVSGGSTYYPLTGHVDSDGFTENPLGVTFTVQDAHQDLDVKVDYRTADTEHWRIRQDVIDLAIRRVRGSRENLVVNGGLNAGSGGYSFTGTAGRTTSGVPTGVTGAVSLPGGSIATYNAAGTAVGLSFIASRVYTLVLLAKLLTGSADELTVTYGAFGGVAPAIVTASTGTTKRPSLSSSYQTYTYEVTLPETAGHMHFILSCTSGDDAKGAEVGAFMIVEGRDVPDNYVDFGAPTGRLFNWLSGSRATIDDGWTNLVANPEVVTDTTGWTGYGGTDSTNLNAAVAAVTSDANANSYATASWTPHVNWGYVCAVMTEHASDAQIGTPSGNGLTWVQIATVQSSTGIKRMTLWRAMKGSGLSAGVTTITVAGASNIGCDAQIFEFPSVDTSGTNGSGFVIQSATATGTGTVNAALTVAHPFSTTFGAFVFPTGASVDSGTYNTISSGSGAAPSFNTVYAVQKTFGASTAIIATGGGAGCGIGIEIRSGNGTVTRVTAGSYGTKSYATAIAGNYQNLGYLYAVSGTQRSGKVYSAQVDLGPIVTGSGTLTLGVGSLGTAGDQAIEEFTFGASDPGVVVDVSVTLTGDRSDLGVWLIRPAGAAAVGTYPFTAVALTAGFHQYARTGITSPATLSEAASITTVFNSTLGRDVTRVTTYATAGSGIAVDSLLLHANGVYDTGSVLLRVTSGSANVTLGVGDPYGPNAAVSNSSTVALTTTFRTVAQLFTGTTDNFASGAGLVLWVAAASAGAVTFEISDVALYAGKATQRFAPLEASGIDVADTDLGTAALVDAQAMSFLSQLNGISGAASWIEGTANRPYWKYMTGARQSLVGKAVARSLTNVQGISSLNHARQNTNQRVVVVYGAATVDNTATASSSQAIRDRTGTVRELVIDAGALISEYDAAQEIADLVLGRTEIARANPTIQIMHSGTEASTALAVVIFASRPNDLVLVTTANADRGFLLSAAPLIILATTITKSDGVLRSANFETEDFRPS